MAKVIVRSVGGAWLASVREASALSVCADTVDGAVKSLVAVDKIRRVVTRADGGLEVVLFLDDGTVDPV